MEVGYTLKFVKDLSFTNSTPAEIDDHLEALYMAEMSRHKALGVRFVDFILEKSKTGLLHVHAHVRLDKKLYSPKSPAWYNRYNTFRTKFFSCKMKHATTLPKWKKYMLKDCDVPGKYFKQGVWLTPRAEAEMVTIGASLYDSCVVHEVGELEKYIGKLGLNNQKQL